MKLVYVRVVGHATVLIDETGVSDVGQATTQWLSQVLIDAVHEESQGTDDLEVECEVKEIEEVAT